MCQHVVVKLDFPNSSGVENSQALPEGYQNAKYEVQVLSESFKDCSLKRRS